ncbi:nucleotidyltransferase [Aquibacillus albus]|uniref:tRNA(Met) cytidine acetate ligase n=1 Tax=Aquibacillus albus TaxID=1168171 RepID=A0ABS2N0P5_9BACI|nr:nucleotidyltransferase [Aquibacillus albus]MBM7571719.1 putative nucleotidyltransferase [Aquibacillus albus]
MRACGLIVEYNPFHNGHKYHLEESKQISSADCMVAVMSGNFLQRGEPALLDKFHRAKVAIKEGVDIVLELPFAYAVQNSDLFARGAILTLDAVGVSSLCFGSEHGEIKGFLNAYHSYIDRQEDYKRVLKAGLETGLSFPEASKHAYHHIGLTEGEVDLSKPNNILGFSYIKGIYETNPTLKALTIQRIKNDYHDQNITHEIASATSIRKELLEKGYLSDKAKNALPPSTQLELEYYYQKASLWHYWEHYFPLLQYRVQTMSEDELRAIQGVEEGLENRIKATANKATSFDEWMTRLKTKRYTWTRLQRTFVHILTNTKKATMETLLAKNAVPYVRLLGMSKKGQSYLNQQKKHLDKPIITSLKKTNDSLLLLDERATDAYYCIIPPHKRNKLRQQEIKPPFMLHS